MPPHFAALALAVWFAAVPGATAPSSHDIDVDVWSVFVATVATDDIVGMGKRIFPQRRTCEAARDPAHQADAGGVGTRHGRREGQGQQGDGGVPLFSTPGRRHDGVRSWHIQVQRYRAVRREQPKYYPFEELLAKTNRKWRVLMERQFAEVTQDAWDKLPE